MRTSRSKKSSVPRIVFSLELFFGMVDWNEANHSTFKHCSSYSLWSPAWHLPPPPISPVSFSSPRQPWSQWLSAFGWRAPWTKRKWRKTEIRRIPSDPPQSIHKSRQTAPDNRPASPWIKWADQYFWLSRRETRWLTVTSEREWASSFSLKSEAKRSSHVQWASSSRTMASPLWVLRSSSCVNRWEKEKDWSNRTWRAERESLHTKLREGSSASNASTAGSVTETKKWSSDTALSWRAFCEFYVSDNWRENKTNVTLVSFILSSALTEKENCASPVSLRPIFTTFFSSCFTRCDERNSSHASLIMAIPRAMSLQIHKRKKWGRKTITHTHEKRPTWSIEGKNGEKSA